MNLTKSRVITISANATLVKAAQVTRNGVVEKLARRNIENGLIDVALRQVLAGFDVGQAQIVWVLPGEVATTKNVEVPSTDNDEIESILSLQAARHTPFNKEEILTSYLKVGVSKPNFTQVLLIIVKRDAIKEKIDILKGAGLVMDTVLFAPEAVARFYAQAFNVKKTDAPVALLDVSMQGTNFIVQSNGTAVMSRHIPVGIEQLAVDAEAVRHMSDEIKVSLEAYEQEGVDRKPVKFCFTTDHPALAAVPQVIAEALGIQVDIQSYKKFVKCSKVVQKSLANDFADDSALDIIAAGVSAAKCQAELVPQEVRDQRSVAEKGRDTLVAGVLFLCALFLVGFALLSKVYFKDQFLQQNLLLKYSAQRAEVKNLESMIARTEILRQYLQARSLPLEAVRELYRIIPQEIFLSAVNMDDAGMVSIQGISDSMSKVFGFVTALETSPLFEGVKTKSTSTKKDRGKEVAAFEIIMKLSAAEEPVAVPNAAPETKEAAKVKKGDSPASVRQ
ncbi:MAG: pilus assembly protein PilM [Candidatus Omnitrophica bacterium]|nr:pilus assembly protein PilM [Candidatus Omnitrophota bacterium]